MSENDWRLWLGVVVAAISLLWNLANTIYTHRSSRKVRDATIALDEFKKSIRDPIFDAIAKCEEVFEKVEAIAASGKAMADLAADIESANRDAISCLSKLGAKLGDAEISKFVKTNDWLDGFDNCEDRILGCFNEACNPVNSEPKRREALARVFPLFRSFRSSLRKRLENEVMSIAA